MVQSCRRPAGQRGTALLLILTSAALVLVAPSPVTALPELVRSSTGATDPTGPLLAAVALCAWLCAAWLLASTALTAAGRLLPGPAGRTIAALATRCAPMALRRVAELALGVTVATASLGGSGAWAQDAHPAAAAAARMAASPLRPVPAPQIAPSLDLDWPTSRATTGPGPGRPATALASPETAGPPIATALPTPTSASRPATAPAGPAPVRRTGSTVVVHPGDCLWDLARAALGPAATDRQVARAWPSWWSVNRTVIGDNPDLIQPGTHLVRPTP